MNYVSDRLSSAGFVMIVLSFTFLFTSLVPVKSVTADTLNQDQQQPVLQLAQEDDSEESDMMEDEDDDDEERMKEEEKDDDDDRHYKGHKGKYDHHDYDGHHGKKGFFKYFFWSIVIIHILLAIVTGFAIKNDEETGTLDYLWVVIVLLGGLLAGVTYALYMLARNSGGSGSSGSTV